MEDIAKEKGEGAQPGAEHRAHPACPLFGSCGGCTSQHIPYEVQAENKRVQVERIVKRARPEWEGHAQKETGEAYAYRNRMDFVFASGGASGVGLREKGVWWKIIPVASCPISNAALNALLREANAWAGEHKRELQPFDLKKGIGTLRYAVIRTNRDGTDSSISFVLNETSSKLQEHIELIREFAQRSTAKNILVTEVSARNDVSVGTEYFCVKGSEYLEETLLGRRMRYPVQGFFQNNPVMAQGMMEHVRKILESEAISTGYLVDLYGGVGTFALAAGDLFPAGITIESFEESTRYARENLDANAMQHIEAISLDAASLAKLDLGKKAGGAKLHIILDPPRSGMHPKTIAELNRLNPEMMVYISCNPEQLGKDLIHFKGHAVEQVAVFDLFPQTPHVETVVVLRHI